MKRVITQLTLTDYEDETMSIEGPMHDPGWCLAALDHARDVLKRRQKEQKIILPAHDLDKVLIK